MGNTLLSRRWTQVDADVPSASGFLSGARFGSVDRLIPSLAVGALLGNTGERATGAAGARVDRKMGACFLVPITAKGVE